MTRNVNLPVSCTTSAGIGMVMDGLPKLHMHIRIFDTTSIQDAHFSGPHNHSNRSCTCIRSLLYTKWDTWHFIEVLKLDRSSLGSFALLLTCSQGCTLRDSEALNPLRRQLLPFCTVNLGFRSIAADMPPITAPLEELMGKKRCRSLPSHLPRVRRFIS